MGVVQKQGVAATIVSYAGAVLGAINKLLLFPQLLTVEQVGLANVFLVIGVIYAQFSALGTPNAILRFFPYFRNKDQHHHGFLPWILIANLGGFLLISLVFLLLKPEIISIWQEKSPLLVDYYEYLIPLGLGMVIFNVFESYLRSLYKTAVTAFFKEFMQRFMVTISITLFALELIDFKTFVGVYVILLAVTALFPLIYTAWIGELHFKLIKDELWQRHYGELIRYSSASFMAYAASATLLYVDSIMLTGYGLGDVGIYTTVGFATTLLLIPWRSLSRITGPLVAEHWKENRMAELQDLYQRTSLISMFVAFFGFLGLWINRENFFWILGTAYGSGVWVLLILGIARVYDMTTGLNGIILNTSKKYIYDFFLQIGLIIVGILLNAYLIPTYGIEGAAIATMLSIIIFNTIRTILVYAVFRLHPLQLRMLYLLLLAGFTYMICELIPPFSNHLLDILARSIICTILFVGIALGAKISPDINDYVYKIWFRLSKMAKGKG